MNNNIIIDMADTYAQARTTRAERSHACVLLGVGNEFVYKQLLSLLPSDTELVLVGDGENVLEAYLACAPDMLILEPKMDEHGALPHIYEVDGDNFVVLLADGMCQQEIMDALETGAQGFLTKPYTQRKMSHYLELLHTAKAQRQQAVNASSVQQ